MQFKVDENLPAEVAELLRTTGHDALTIQEQKLVGSGDAAIAQVCRDEARSEVLRTEIKRRLANTGTPLSQPLDRQSFKAEARRRLSQTS
ncbi:DUF5615 family PIN-like protein [bacterium]|nr:DUF5615 family PIN-like protein [bacterium]